MSSFWEGVVTIGLAIVTLGMVAVVVSKKAQTPQVIQAAASGFSNALGIAEAPVTGASYTPVLSYPSAGLDMSGSFGYG